MKKGKYIDYNIMLACLAKAPGKTVHQKTSEHAVADSSLLLPALQQKLGLHRHFVTLAQRFASVPGATHTEAA